MAAENPGKASVVEDVMVTIEDQTESHPSAGDKPRSRTGAHKPTHNLQGESASFDKSFIFVAENEIEAHRISNNYKVCIKFRGFVFIIFDVFIIFLTAMLIRNE